MTALPIYRKCYKCGYTNSNDLNNDKCKCGGYLYLISQIYTPKVGGAKNELSKRGNNALLS